MKVYETALLVGAIYATDHDVIDFSGEWADRITGPQMVEAVLKKADIKHADGSSSPFGHAPGTCEVCDWWDASGDILDAVEAGFNFYHSPGGI
jgi:hypothetical protein